MDKPQRNTSLTLDLVGETPNAMTLLGVIVKLREYIGNNTQIDIISNDSDYYLRLNSMNSFLREKNNTLQNVSVFSSLESRYYNE